MFFRSIIAVGILFLVSRGAAFAGVEPVCPPDCPVKGGGPTSTDCLLEFGGVTATQSGGRVVECTDGDPTCDHNPDLGVCGFEIQACVNNADPSVPSCTANTVTGVRIRGGGQGGRDLGDAIGGLLPTSENVCTDPVSFDVPISAEGGPALGRRRFSLSQDSSFQISGVTLASFEGYVDLEAGPVDPNTGLALVDVVGSSDYLSANIFGGALILCLKPVVPVQAAGVIACGNRRDGGRSMRIVASGPNGSDRDGLLLRCHAAVNYTTQITIDRDIGVVGEDGFTMEQCLAAGGTVNPANNFCISGFIIGQLDDTSSALGELFMAPGGGLNGFGVEITQQSSLPCSGDGTGGMSAAIALTTMRSEGQILDAGNSPGAVVVGDVEGEPFDCDDFTTEDGPGVLVFAVPQLNLPVFGDGVTQFSFSDK